MTGPVLTERTLDELADHYWSLSGVYDRDACTRAWQAIPRKWLCHFAVLSYPALLALARAGLQARGNAQRSELRSNCAVPLENP